MVFLTTSAIFAQAGNALAQVNFASDSLDYGVEVPASNLPGAPGATGTNGANNVPGVYAGDVFVPIGNTQSGMALIDDANQPGSGNDGDINAPAAAPTAVASPTPQMPAPQMMDPQAAQPPGRSGVEIANITDDATDDGAAGFVPDELAPAVAPEVEPQPIATAPAADAPMVNGLIIEPPSVEAPTAPQATQSAIQIIEPAVAPSPVPAPAPASTPAPAPEAVALSEPQGAAFIVETNTPDDGLRRTISGQVVPVARLSSHDDIIVSSPVYVPTGPDAFGTRYVLQAGDNPQEIFWAMNAILASNQLGLREGERKAVQAFYKERGGRLLFVSEQPAREALDGAIARSAEHGLPKNRYAMPVPRSSARAEKLAHEEVKAAALLVRYARDMERGVLSPKQVSIEIDVAPKGRSPLKLLQDFAASANKRAFFSALEPNDPAYPLLKRELAKLRGSASSPGIPQGVARIPSGPTIKPGDSGPRVHALRSRLMAEGIGIAGQGGQPDYFDATLVAAVREFQNRRSLSPDGSVGPATLAALNGESGSNKLTSVLVALERHRWLDNNRSGRQLFVNIPNYVAEIRDDNQKVYETIIVVGKPDDYFRTPEFTRNMTHLIVNPKWNVPESISVKEYLPKLQKDPTILDRENIVMTIKGSGQIVDPRRIDMNQFNVDDFPFHLQQQEGDDNALGNVKFMLPNRHNIYLHDTPSKYLFNEKARAFSHGCVRVHKPEELAAFLLAQQMASPRETYQGILQTGIETQLDLIRPIPVHLTYFTAYMNSSGAISYTNDVYGRDKMVREHLANAGVAF